MGTVQNPIVGNIAKSEVRKQLEAHIWKQVNKIILLDEQMRCTDEAYLALMNRLREGKCNDSDISMLNGRVIGQTMDVPIIKPGNQLVMATPTSTKRKNDGSGGGPSTP